MYLINYWYINVFITKFKAFCKVQDYLVIENTHACNSQYTTFKYTTIQSKI